MLGLAANPRITKAIGSAVSCGSMEDSEIEKVGSFGGRVYRADYPTPLFLIERNTLCEITETLSLLDDFQPRSP